MFRSFFDISSAFFRFIDSLHQPCQKARLPVMYGTYDDGRNPPALALCALMLGLFVISQSFSSPNGVPQILSADELAGWDLFRGKAKCNACHLDGTESLAGKPARKITSEDAGSKAPLITDFTSSNLGMPRNPAIPYFNYNKPDRYGYTANPAGPTYVDKVVGDFLRNPQLNPNSDWARLAPQFDGKFQVSTLRNVDKRPRPDFVKAYMHNGYFKSLKEVVHFYKGRDKLPVARMALRERRRRAGPPLSSHKTWTRRSGTSG
jgi:hypothetical protein